MMNTLNLDMSQIQRLIPGFLLLDVNLTIINAGYEMVNLCSVTVPEPFTDKFTIVSPVNCSLHDINSSNKILLECRNHQGMFEATVERLPHSDYILIACTAQKIQATISETHPQEANQSTNTILSDTTKKHTQDQLFMLNAALENSDIAMLTTDTQGIVRWVNQACQQLIGYSYDELIDTEFVNLWHNVENKDPNLLRTYIENYSFFEFELYHVGIKTESKWIYVKGQQIVEGSIKGCVVTLQDITQKKQIELHGYKNAKRLQDLVVNLNDAVLLENEKRQIEIINKRFCQLFSIPYSPEMLLGADCTQAAENFKHLFMDEDEFVRRIESILVEKKHVVGEKLQLKDGRWFEREFIPTMTDRQYLGHLWIYSDITERTSYQQKISEQREFYETVLNQIPSDIAVFDKSHHYLFVNPIGIKNPEIRQWIIGKTDYDYCEFRNKPRSIADDRHELFNSVIQTKELRVWEEELTGADGNLEYYLRYMYPVLDQENEVTMVIGYGVNITERKKAEKAIAEALAQQKELYVMKSNFVSMISHEFRTPLSTVLSSTQLLKKYSNSLTDEKKEKHLLTIEKAVHRMTSLLENVLFIGRNDSNKLTFSPVTIDIAIFVNELIEDFILANSGVNRIVSTYEINSPTLFADRGLLRQILSNLLTNAYKYSSTESDVELFVYVDEKKGVFVVKDKGIGIPDEDQNHLFDEFHRAANVGNIQGTGLGLSIVKRCVDAHSGNIDVQSKVGKGTVFTVAIPQNKEEII